MLVRPASVDLRIGRQYIDCQDKIVRVQTRGADKSAVIKLPPLGALIFSTLESVHTPDNVVGRFDLKIGYALQGLVLQVGPQIEPLYKGPLFGLLINLSDAEIALADNVLLTAEFSLLPDTNRPTVPRKKTFQDLKDFVESVPDVVKGIRTTRLAAVQRDIEEHTELARLLRDEVTSFRSEANAIRSQKFQLAAIGVAVVGLCLSLSISVTGLIFAIVRTGAPMPPAQPAPTATNTASVTGLKSEVNVFVDPMPVTAPATVVPDPNAPPPEADKAKNASGESGVEPAQPVLQSPSEATKPAGNGDVK